MSQDNITTAFTIVLIMLFIALIYLLMKDKGGHGSYEDEDDDEDGGVSPIHWTSPDIPLPPGIRLPLDDFEPEYNKRKEYV